MRKGAAIWVLLLLLTGPLAGCQDIGFGAGDGGTQNRQGPDAPLARNMLDLAGLDGFFTRNDGQLRDIGVRYTYSSPGVNFAFMDSAVIMVVESGNAAGDAAVIRLSFDGSNPVTPLGKGELAHYSNYFIGNDPSCWRTDVPNYKKVVYRGLYDGIDLVYYFSEEGLKYDWIVAPGTDPAAIVERFEGAMSLFTEPGGDLQVVTASGALVFPRPVCYQYEGGEKKIVPADFYVQNNLLRYRLGQYDADQELVIDPLVYSTYVGTDGEDTGWRLAVDSNRCVYVVGKTESNGFPTTSGALNQSYNGGTSDFFVFKLKPDGSGLVYSTFVGSPGTEAGYPDIAVDSAGNAYVTGATDSSSFPTTSGSYDSSFNGGSNDAVLFKLNRTGSRLVYSTYIGSSGVDGGMGLAIDQSDCAYVVGVTDNSGFPTTSGCFDGSYGGGTDAFIFKMNANGSKVVYSTFIGGTDQDYSWGVTVDSNGTAYVTGSTKSSNFPTSSGCFDSSHNGGYDDGYLLALNATGSGLVYSTYIGSSGYDYGFDIAIDSSGQAVLVGRAESSDFPTTAGAFDTSYNGGLNGDMFVLKLNSSGSGLVFSTFIGGTDSDEGYSVALDSDDNVYMVGYTESSDFPTTTGCYDSSSNGDKDAVFVLLASNGAKLLNSTFIGGSADDHGYQWVDIALDPYMGVYIAGSTKSTDFPTTNGCYDGSHNGDFDAYVIKFDPPGVTKIYNVYDLQNMSLDLNGSYELVNDIDGSVAKSWNGGKGFLPVGNSSAVFTGGLDGKGFHISDLSINRSAEKYIGLFGYLGPKARISNLNLTDIIVAGNDYVGCLVGYNRGEILNSTTIGMVNGSDDYVGGLVGENSGTISNSTSMGTVNGSGRYVGGIVGGNSGTISNSTSMGTVNGSGSYVGGIVGENSGTISNSTSMGTVNGSEYVGGIVGENSGTISNSTSMGTVNGSGYVGGLVGYNRYGTVVNSYYNIDSVLINGGNHLTLGGLFVSQYQDWCSNGMSLRISDYSSSLRPSGEGYDINSVQGLRDFLGFAANEEYSFRLAADLDLSTTPGLWFPYIAADFDGGGHTLSNIRIDLPFAGDVGMFGHNDGGTIQNIRLVNNDATGYQCVGGLLGFNRGVVSNCTGNGIVKGGSHYTGGLVGYNEGAISNCTSTETVKGSSCTGGLIGYNYEGIVSNCTATGPVNGSSSRVGGLVGESSGPISNCTSAGAVTGVSEIGGLVGRNYDKISDCIVLGPVNGSYAVGGLVALNHASASRISNCLSAGRVNGSSRVGGLVGRNNGTIEDSYWDNVTSERTSSAGGHGRNTTDMKHITTFTGWDFRNVWAIVEDVTYPFLRAGDHGALGQDHGLVIMNRPETTVWVDHPYVVEFLAYDPDKHARLNWSLDTNASWLALDSGSGLLSGTPGPSDAGSYRVKVTVCNSFGKSVSLEYTLKVIWMRPPVWSRIPGDSEILEGEDFDFTAEATDPDPDDVIAYGVSSSPGSGISVNSSRGRILWSKASVGKYTINLTATDGNFTIWHIFNLTVVKRNYPPVWSSVPKDADRFEGDDYLSTASASDRDGPEAITYGLITEPSCGMTVDSNTGALSWAGTVGGKYIINVTASDGKNLIWHVFNLTVAGFTDLVYNDPAKDDFTSFWEGKGSDPEPTGSFGIRGKEPSLDIKYLEMTYDPASGKVTIKIGFLSGPVHRTYICFVDASHRQPEISNTSAVSYYESNHTYLYLSVNNDWGRISGSSSRGIPSLSFRSNETTATFSFLRMDLVEAGARPGFGLYAISYSLAGWPGTTWFNQMTWDSIGVGAADAPAEFNTSRYDALFGAGMFGSGSFPDAKGDDYTTSCDYMPSSTLISESYGVKGRFPAADISDLKAVYDPSTDNYTLTMSLAADPQFKASKPGINTMYFFCIVDSSFVQPKESAPTLQSLSDRDLTAFIVDFMRGFLDPNHTLMSVFVGDDPGGKVTCTPGLSYRSEGRNLSVVFDRAETCEGLRLRSGSFYTGELRVFAYSLRMTEKEGKDSNVLHISWDTAGAGAVAPPPEINARAWEERYGKGKTVQPGMDPLLLPLLLVVMIVAAAAGAGGYVYVRKKRASEEEALLAKEKAEAVPWVSPEDNAAQKRQKEWAEYEKMYGQPHPDSPEGIRRKAMQAETSADSQADPGQQPPQDGAEAPAQDGQSVTETPPATAPDQPAPEPPAQESRSAPAPPEESAPAEK